MANVPRPNIQWRGAHPNNFTVGRPGAGRDGRNSNHHVVGSAESAVLVFQNPNRGASSTYVVTDVPDLIFQTVSLDDTPYTDGNWESNLRTVSMEHHGDWRNGYDNPVVRENSAKLVAWLRDQGIVNRPIRHRDVSRTPTVCPADLPVESIWNRATEIINYYNQPVDNRPEWMKNRSEVSARTVYAQTAGIFVHNLNAPGQPLDTRRFVLNQNFEIKGQTRAGGKEYWITRSSYDANIASGILKSDVADQPYVPPVPQPIPAPPVPATPEWADSLLVDEENREMYVLRATPLIDLENGRPAKDSTGKDIWFQAGDIIKDVSAHTIVAEVTYQLTEFSFQKIRAGEYAKFGNGIKAADLTVDPKATPIGTPANPQLPQAPTDPIEDMPDVPTPPATSEPTTPTIPDVKDDGVIQPRPPVTYPQNPSTPAVPKLSAWLKLLLWFYNKFVLPRLNAKKK